MPSGHLHLFGQLNRVDGNFVLDTGAGTTVIEKRIKRSLACKQKQQKIKQLALAAQVCSSCCDLAACVRMALVSNFGLIGRVVYNYRIAYLGSGCQR